MDEKKEEQKSKPLVIPLISMVQSARYYMREAVEQIMSKTGLPTYLMDGVISEVLADIRKQELCDVGIQTTNEKGDG